MKAICLSDEEYELFMKCTDNVDRYVVEKALNWMFAEMFPDKTIKEIKSERNIE